MRWKLVLLGFFAFYQKGSAQHPVVQTKAVENHVEQTLSVSVDRVNVLFTVAKGGRLVTGLKKDDFVVLEDGKPQTISNFGKEGNLPLNIGLLIDTSGSVWNKLRFEREAAIKFFYSILRPAQDKAFVMAFDTKASILQDYTDKPDVLKHSMEHMIAGGSTSLYDAVSEAAIRKFGNQSGRHVLIVISDGFDNASHVNLKGALETAQKNDVVIYAISTNRIEGLLLQDPDAGDSNLAQLSGETGGYAFFPKHLEDLSHAFYRIGQDLRSQYSLAYGPTNTRRDGTFRLIEIVPSRKGYQVHCRHGYFAPQRSSG
jgi:Ca-activated chloride channel family protein